jgi:hypothetical protein
MLKIIEIYQRKIQGEIPKEDNEIKNLQYWPNLYHYIEVSRCIGFFV